MPIELHCHSTASDGALTPEGLVERALAHGLTTLALTDHDTVAGVEPALAAARSTSLRVISGVELSCHFEGREVHLLGYLFEHRDPDFLELLERLKQEREERIHRILEKLARLGVGLTYEEVEASAPGEILGRPHVAQALIARGRVSTFDEAFERYLGARAPAYVGRTVLPLAEGIAALRRAGGCSVLAHPGLLGDWAKVERILRLGVDGMEVWHPSHPKAARKRARKLGGRYGVVLTGGSDFHRPTPCGADLGSSPVTEKVITKLHRAAKGCDPCEPLGLTRPPIFCADPTASTALESGRGSR